MAIINRQLLIDLGACSLDIEHFDKVYPNGVELNSENYNSILQNGVDLAWLTMKLFPVQYYDIMEDNGSMSVSHHYFDPEYKQNEDEIHAINLKFIVEFNDNSIRHGKKMQELKESFAEKMKTFGSLTVGQVDNERRDYRAAKKLIKKECQAEHERIVESKEQKFPRLAWLRERNAKIHSQYNEKWQASEGQTVLICALNIRNLLLSWAEKN